MRTAVLLASVFAVALSLVSAASAAVPSGRWEGTYRCHGADSPMTVTITSDGGNGGRAVMEFRAGGVRGSYALNAHIREDSRLLRLTPSEWISQPDPRYMMIGFEGHVTGGRISGQTFGIAECTTFTLAQTGAAPDTRPGPGTGSAGGDGRTPRPVPIAPVPDVRPPPQPTPAPQPLPQSTQPGRTGEVGDTNLLGQWALNLPGGGMWTKSFEDDLARQIRTTTHNITIAKWLSDAGALEVNRDGTYRINWTGERWSGRWEQDAEYGGIRLRHPTEPRKDWVAFVRDGRPRAAQANTLSGFTLTEMTRIASPAVAEYVLAPTATGDLVGRWSLSDAGVGMGVLEVNADGTYRHTGGPDGALAGMWSRGPDGIVLQNYGRAGNVSLHADATVPGRVVISGGAVQMVGAR